MNRSRYSTLLATVLLVLIIWVTSLMGGFTLLNAWACDLFTRITVKTKTSELVLLMEVNSQQMQQNDKHWNRVLRYLLELQPKAIAFTFFPPNATEGFYQQAEQSRITLFGRTPHRSDDDGQTLHLPPLPKHAEKFKLPYGLVMTAPDSMGVYRSQSTQVMIDNKQLPTLEAVVAQQILSTAASIPAQSFQINFIGGHTRLAKIDFKRALSAGLVAELVRDRVIIIADRQPTGESWLHTPLSATGQLTPAAQFHALAMETLLSQRFIQDLSPAKSLVVLSLIIALFLLLYQWLPVHLSFWVTLTVLLMYSALSWLVLHHFNLRLPYTEMFIVQLTIFFMIIKQRAVTEEINSRTMLLDLSIQLKDKIFINSFYRSEDHWHQLISMVNQTLNLSRAIFLEKVEGDHRLREIKALNCSLDDIDERRRDYQRTPYSAAISENGPIEINISYLKNIGTAERQFLAPLVFSGEVLGFWALGIAPDKLQAMPDFNALLKVFTRQISELLNNRQIWQTLHQKQHSKLLNYLHFQGGERASNTLRKSLALRERRSEYMYDIFNQATSASILYDLFGRVILVNQQMEALAQSSAIKPYTRSLLEFVIQMTGFSTENSRSLIQATIFDREMVTIQATELDPDKKYLLHLKPLLKEGSALIYGGYEMEEAHPFQLNGIVCELVDITTLAKHISIHERILKRVSAETLKQLRQTSDQVAGLQTTRELTRPKYIKAVQTIQHELQQATHMLEALEQASPSHIHLGDSHPDRPVVDGMATLLTSVDELQSIVKNQAVKIHVNAAESLCLTIAAETELQAGFNAILNWMIEDTIDQGEIRIQVKDKQNYFLFQFRNDGFGLPNERLQAYLQNDDEQLITHDMKQLRRLRRCVSRWRGRLQIRSGVGEGLKVDLLLQRFV